MNKLLSFKLRLIIVVCACMPFLLPVNDVQANSVRSNQAYKLTNVFVTASFNEAGLTSIFSKSTRKKSGFIADGFSIIIDGKRMRQSGLKCLSVQTKKNRLVYTYENKLFTIWVIYELRPSWHFISKQLKIKAKEGKAFTVNKVSVLHEKLDDSVTSNYIPKTLHSNLGPKDFGVFLRFADHTGMFALVQNPFLTVQRQGSLFDISYKPDMQWNPADGAFSSDRACLGTYKLSGHKIPVQMIAEWKWKPDINQNTKTTEDQAEVQAFTHCVSKFITDHTKKPINVNVGWTENDYQIDVSTQAGRDVYKRIIDQASNIGTEYLVYAPTNSKLATFKQAVDDWKWEEALWLGLGVKIRKNEWNPRTDSLPSSVKEMLDYANSRNVKLLAYVYPVMPFKQNKKWLVSVGKGANKKQFANLGFRSYQNWLIEELSAFKKKTGIGGFSFDYTFLTYPGKSVYAQWKGWQRVMMELRKRFPNIVMDGRQAYQDYGPWSWLAGSYPHPTSTDEQPESFTSIS